MGSRVPWRMLADVTLLAAAIAPQFAFGCVVIVGRSMEPALKPGDLVVYRRGAVEARVGDLLVMGAGQPFVHRVVGEATSGAYLTRGDANPIADLSPVPRSEVRGRVAAVLPTAALLSRLDRLLARARLWSQSHTAAMTETTSARRRRASREGPRDWKGPGGRRGRFPPSAAT